jgi:erythronate-4-phosphate dehydrogenase
LNIVADAHIWGVEEAFSSLPGLEVSLTILEASEITRAALQQADVLITRSSTKVNEALLTGTPVSFAATATIGDDHYDKKWLSEHDIAFANAAGSSTGSVVEYMLTALLELHARKIIALPDITLGIIGAGRIGSALADICSALHIDTLLNDPPREECEGNDGFSDLDELLNKADVLSLHTPLTRTGDSKTHHLLDAERLARFRGYGIINTSRGSCLDNSALLNWLDGNKNRFAVLDCWENEPTISSSLLAHPQLAIATPHIAGHSLDGKAANTLFAYRALCKWLKTEPVWHPEKLLPTVETPLKIACGNDAWLNLHAAATRLYPIMQDDTALRGIGHSAGKGLGKGFADYRRHYPIRRSWKQVLLQLQHSDPLTLRLAQAMGIKIV